MRTVHRRLYIDTWRHVPLPRIACDRLWSWRVNILLVCPEYPDTFWSFKHALSFIARKAAQPPLGLLTVAAMLPGDWSKKLVDLNLSPLEDRDLSWADFVFLGGMSVQADSARTVIARCNAALVPVVAGGPLFTARHEEFTGVAHFVLNEAEITLPLFLDDLRRGTPRPVYTTTAWADLSTTPLPLWELVDQTKYATMNVQYSRGCPYDCEFCDITVLYGHRPRTKSADQVIAELDALAATGWRGHVFFVDDNFIGNKDKLKREVLPAIIGWMRRHNHPFSLGTEASLNLADDPVLLQMVARAGFEEVFVGIESPNPGSIEECRKVPNKGRDMIASVKVMQRAGLQVQGGFIVGFDNDPPSIFDALIHFIRESGIVVAMVGLLNAPINSRLHARMKSENRLRDVFSGDNTDFSMNFSPKMDRTVLIEGYRRILETVYAPGEYYRRVRSFLRSHRPPQLHRAPIGFAQLSAVLRSMVLLGVLGSERIPYWQLFFWALFRRPGLFATAITLAIYGSHFRKVAAHSTPGPV
jgi:radical SAM superfamily enzyme YgiQ (UPF0313 family)